MRVSDLRIGVRLGAGFAVVLLFLLVVAFTGWWSLARIKQHSDIIVNERDIKVQLASDMRRDVNNIAKAVRDYLIYTDPGTLNLQLGHVMEANKRIEEAIAKSMPLLRTEAARNAIAEIKAQRERMAPLVDNVMALVDAGKPDEAKEFLRESLQRPQDKWLATIQAYIDMLQKQNEAAVAEMDRDYSRATIVLVGAALAALLVGVASAWRVTRSITEPIRSAVALAEAVAEGDLTTRIEIDRTDETGQLLHALRKMNDNLIRIVSGVRSGTHAIVTASSEIANGNLDLSSRTEQQAGSLEETASSMDELTATVKQNADNARQANALAQSASDVATRGGVVVKDVVETMESINAAARKIVDIIAVIDSIAFQTNILALNAAVEAARAGEQGRGFAVVAGEVRNLAQRSAAAAKEIKDLIGQSVDRVDAGCRLVNQAGGTMDEVIGSVRRVTGIMAEITAASNEQAEGIAQINQAIAQMDGATQQNASLVEEAAAAAQALQNQAGELAQLVSVFRVEETAAAPRLVAVRPNARTAAAEAPVGPHDRREHQGRRLTVVAGTGGDGWEEF